MYEAAQVSVAIGGKAILQPSDLALAPGTVTVLIGPNGAGKSTLLKVMAGERRPNSGRVRLDGRDVAAMPARDLARVRAVLPQSAQVAFPFTVSEVVRLGMPPGLTPLRAAELAERALAAVDLPEEGERICSTLSGGEQQRVHLARVLAQLWGAGRPETYLLLDEPTASLDLSHQLLVLKLAREHATSGGGVLAILHDLNLAAMVADTIVVLDRGRVAAAGEPAAAITRPMLAEVYRVDLAIEIRDGRVLLLPAGMTPVLAPSPTDGFAPSPKGGGKAAV